MIEEDEVKELDDEREILVEDVDKVEIVVELVEDEDEDEVNLIVELIDELEVIGSAITVSENTLM
jgi:hypothetical protein